VACEEPDGQIFCNSKWVDHGGHLADCIAAIREHVDAEFEASSSASCDDGTCEASAEAKGKASANCSMRPAAPQSGLGFWSLGAAGLALVAARRWLAAKK
jgi:hypothetical protein